MCQQEQGQSGKASFHALYQGCSLKAQSTFRVSFPLQIQSPLDEFSGACILLDSKYSQVDNQNDMLQQLIVQSNFNNLFYIPCFLSQKLLDKGFPVTKKGSV